MSCETLTAVMPDFRQGHFFETYFGIIKHFSINEASAYFVSMAALMLGCDVCFHRFNKNNKTKNIFPYELPTPSLMQISSGKRSYSFWATSSEKTVAVGSAIEAKDKIRAKHVLSHAGIATPLGGAATARNYSILNGLSQAGIDTVILKPASSSRSHGIIERVTLETARQHIIAHPGTVFVVEQFIPGRSIRAHVVGNQVCASVYLRPLSVIGDGRSTIRQLIEFKIQLREAHPRYKVTPLKIREIQLFLREHNVSPNMILEKGAVLPLTKSSLADDSSDTIYYLDKISDRDRDLAVRAASAMGLKSAGVDLIQGVSGKTYVLEVNTKPAFGFLCMPSHGEWNLRAPEALLRWHFPKIGSKVNRIIRYDFLQLLHDYHFNPNHKKFKAADYITYGNCQVA